MKVEIKHITRENYKINKRLKQINKKFTDLEEETMETVSEEIVFTRFDFACIGEITMRIHENTKHKSVHSNIGAKQIKLGKVQ